MVEKKKVLSEKQKAKQQRRENKARLPFIADEDLQAAKELLAAETEALKNELGEIDAEEYAAAAAKMSEEWVYNASRHEHDFQKNMSKSEVMCEVMCEVSLHTFTSIIPNICSVCCLLF